jgi:predicted secreted protein
MKRHIKGLTIVIGAAPGSPVKIKDGEFNTSVEEVEVTDTGSGGFQEFLEGGGIARGELNFSGWWDDAALPNATPPNITKGAIEPFTVTLAPGMTFAGNVHFTEVNYPFGDVTGGDALSYEATGRTHGAFTEPGATPPAP